MDAGLAGYLRTRRTIPAAQLDDPAPDAAALRAMLEIAARVPDHGKLAPWRFIVFDRDSRSKAVEALRTLAARSVDEKDARMRADKARGFADAPLVVCVVSSPIADHPKIPLWEQQLSAGAVCLNLVHAARAHGFSAQWLTGWYAYDVEAMRLLGIGNGERVAGFVHIGTPKAAAAERDRPDLDVIVSRWAPPD